MRSKGNAPTAAQKRWREAVRELAGASEPSIEIHHPVGVTAKHNKVHIGHWWVIAIPSEMHNKLHAGNLGPLRKEFEKDAFKSVLTFLPNHPDRPAQEVIEAIEDYHR